MKSAEVKSIGSRRSQIRSSNRSLGLENGRVRSFIQRAREALLSQHADLGFRNGRLVRLTLNEAEALAWQTGVPHLTFASLAMEKLEALRLWAERQERLSGSSGNVEVALAE